MELALDEATRPNLFDLNERTLVFTPDGTGQYSREVRALEWKEEIGEAVEHVPESGAVIMLESFDFPFGGRRTMMERPGLQRVPATPAMGDEKVNCEQWNTEDYFQAATVADVVACLKAGANVMARNNYGSTPLHWASGFNGNPAVSEVLLKAGADLRVQADRKFTPLHWAAELNGNAAVSEVLPERRSRPGGAS